MTRTAAAEPAAQAMVAGLVVDLSGAPVAGARLTVESAEQRRELRTGSDGRFSVTQPEGTALTLTATAPGFSPVRARVVAGTDRAAVRLQLPPAALTETVTVTASRGTERLETAAATTVISAAELLNAPAPTIDDTLRGTPGFSLFRRSSSRVANPSTHGVTLRGVSGTGASRTIVLVDGLPLNDPFGSWVYWNRVPQAAIEKVEVVRGAAGDLYGADALGGAVQLLSFAPGPKRVRALLEGGSHRTLRGSGFATASRGHWQGALAVEGLGTDGAFVTSPLERGPVDSRAQSDYATGFASVGFDDGSRRAHARVSGYGEDRNNGTRLVTNDTRWRQLSLDTAGPLASGRWRVRVFAGDQRYFNNFSAVSADRSSERVTRSQEIPSDFAGGSVEWARPLGRHALLLGAEARGTSATVEETRYALGGAASGPFVAGGDEQVGSLFGRANLAAGERTNLVVGARADYWRSDPLDPASPANELWFFSPRLSISSRATEAVTLRASASRAYRTPTLNELHRGFRVGNVVTEGNPLLAPERLTGAELACLARVRAVSARATVFWNRLDDAITNVTIETTPTLITRQKQNTHRTRAAGAELELAVRPHPRVSLSALAVVTDSVFQRTPDQPELEGRRVPQVPRYQLGAGVAFTEPRLLTASVQLRALGEQFDDDQNRFALRPFTVLDVSASRPIGPGLHAFLAVENLLNEEYEVARTPQRQVGWPRTIRAGLRLFRP